jgi:DNA invertase Pin-like site-specific DNA recombinase
MLKKIGCSKIFTEKASGVSKKGRAKLEECLDYLREGDVFVVTRIDRLARSIRDLQNIVHRLKDKGVSFQATEQGVDISTSAGKAFFDMLGVFAEFETNIRKERQLEGIAKAKKAGKFKGRKPIEKTKESEVMQLFNNGVHKKEIAKNLNLGIASIYRIIKRNS